MEERLAALEAQVAAQQSQLEIFGVIDPELATTMLTFWVVTFVTAHGAGRVVKWLGKV